MFNKNNTLQEGVFSNKVWKDCTQWTYKNIGLNFNNQVNLGECGLYGIESFGLNDIKPFQPQDLFHVHF
jgi:hypothetical protein